ncbi:MAG: hypothetical protein JSU08_13770 [Acidobacteria bacterium]|nr:hypothetical protein [Acidobacteriota bacterium]
MRRYSADDEMRVFMSDAVGEWTGAGLLSRDQRQALEPELSVGLRRTGRMLRVGLALFTVIAGAAAVGLVLVVTDLSSEWALSVVTALLAVGALKLADVAAVTYRLYRFGVEEALALGGVGLSAFAAGMLASALFGSNSANTAWLFASAAAGLMAVGIYRCFGFRYAPVLAMVAFALMPLPFDSLTPALKRLIGAVVCATAFVAAHRAGARASDDVRMGDAETLRSAAVAGMYIFLNLQLSGAVIGGTVPGWFRWGTLLLAWALPLWVVRRAIDTREPWLLRVGLGALVLSLATTKGYLGWPPRPWDPIVFGVVLIVGATVLRRWLNAGSAGERNGVTARRLLESDAALMRLVSLTALATPPENAHATARTNEGGFAGGRSGGGGAEAGY